MFIQFASKQSENDDTNTKDGTDDDTKEAISMEPMKETIKNDEPSVKSINPDKVEDSVDHENERHEFVNPILFNERQGGSATPADRRREFFSSMIAAAEASSPLHSNSNVDEETGVELVNVSNERRNTIENIIDSVALDV